MKYLKRLVLLISSFVFVLSVCVQNTTASSTMQSLYDETVIIHGAEKSGMKAVYGIDVSKHQGTIDWKKVKNAGIEFAIIRIGYSTLADGTPMLDPTYNYNIQAARAAGVKVGVYYYSQAINEEEAKKEVDFIIANLKGIRLDLPVVYDAECGTVNGKPGHLGAADLSKAEWTKVAIAFCEGIRAKGYEPMFYGSISKIISAIDYKTIDSRYKMWIARYRRVGDTTPNQLITANYSYSGKYEFWQYSDHGRVDGINTLVDLDLMYVPASSDWKGAVYYNSQKVGSGSGLVASATGSSVKLQWKRAENATSYLVYRSENYTKSFQKIAEVSATTYTDANRVKNKEYFYHIVPRGYINGSVVSGDASSMVRTYCAGTAIGNLQTKSAAYLRKEASTASAKVYTIPKNATLLSYCETKGTDGRVWFKVRYTRGKSSYVGYIHGDLVNLKVTAVSNFKNASYTQNTLTLAWNKVSGVSGYQIYKCDAQNGRYALIATVSGDSNVKYTVKGLSKNTLYYFQIRAYKTVGGKTGVSAFSGCKAGTKPDTARIVKTKKADYLRQHAGTAYKKLIKVPKNAKLKVVRITKDNKNRIWYEAQYTKGKKTYSGFFLKTNTR